MDPDACLLMSLMVQWIPELRHYAPGVPIILVGTKLGMMFHLVLVHSRNIALHYDSDVLMWLPQINEI